MSRKLISSVILVMLLSGCYQKDDLLQALQNNNAKKYATVSVLITDDLSETYREVWVNIKKLEAVDSKSKPTVLFDDPKGRVFNVASLNGIGELLSVQKIPVGQYNAFTLTLDSGLSVVDQNGSVKPLYLDKNREDYILTVDGDLAAGANQSLSFLLDFDLKQFVQQEDTIIPAVFYQTEEAAELHRAFAEVSGKVVAVSPDKITIASDDSEARIHVALHENGVVLDEATGQVAETMDTVNIDDRLEVYGNYDSKSFDIEAISISMNGEQAYVGSDDDAMGKTVEVKGVVKAMENGSMELDINSSSFLPNRDRLSVIDLTNAHYSHGNQGLLNLEQQVEVKGHWDGNQLVATSIGIEGAPVSYQHVGDTTVAMAELEGHVNSYDNGLLTLHVSEAKYYTVQDNPMKIDLSKSWFKKGDASCLIKGAKVEVTGIASVNSNEFNATMIEAGSGCYGKLSSDDQAYLDNENDDKSSDDGVNDDSNDDGSSDDRDSSNDDGVNDDRNDDGSSDDRDSSNDDGVNDDSNDDGSSDDRDSSNDDGVNDDRNDDGSSDDRDSSNDDGVNDDSNDDGSSDDRDSSNDDGVNDDRNDDGSSDDRDSSNDDGVNDDSNDDGSSDDRDSSNDDGVNDDRNDDGSSDDRDSSNDDGVNDDRNDDGSSDDRDSSNDDGVNDDRSGDRDSSFDDRGSSSSDDGMSDDRSGDRDSSSDDRGSSSSDDGVSDDRSGDRDSSSDDRGSSSSDDGVNDDRSGDRDSSSDDRGSSSSDDGMSDDRSGDRDSSSDDRDGSSSDDRSGDRDSSSDDRVSSSSDGGDNSKDDRENDGND